MHGSLQSPSRPLFGFPSREQPAKEAVSVPAEVVDRRSTNGSINSSNSRSATDETVTAGGMLKLQWVASGENFIRRRRRCCGGSQFAPFRCCFCGRFLIYSHSRDSTRHSPSRLWKEKKSLRQSLLYDNVSSIHMVSTNVAFVVVDSRVSVSASTRKSAALSSVQF